MLAASLYTNLDDFVCCLLVAGKVNVILNWIERAVYRMFRCMTHMIEQLHFFYHKIQMGSKDS